MFVAYVRVKACKSAEGMNHCHAVFEDVKPMRFSAIKKIYPSMHIEPTKGNKEQAEDYIKKNPPYDEKGETVILVKYHGEIEGKQGHRSDLDDIEDLIKQGLTPNEIMDIGLKFMKHEKLIRDAYYRKRYKETPIMRQVTVYWHVGESGTGKSYTEYELNQKHGEDNIYRVSEYANGFLDKYNGQKILFMDEMREHMSYTMLLTMLDVYKAQLHSRYTNVFALWEEVHITSIYAPEVYYRSLSFSDSYADSYEQLRRRINFIVYHYKKDDTFCKYELPIKEYTDYKNLKAMFSDEEIESGVDFTAMPDDTPSPFEANEFEQAKMFFT